MSKNFITYAFVIAFLLTVFVSCDKNVANSSDEVNNKTPQELINDGWDEFEAKNYIVAIDKFNEALSLNTELWDAHNGLGWAKGKLGNSSESVNHFLQAIVLNKASLSAIAGLSFIYNAQKQYYESNQRAEEVLQLNAQWVFEHDNRVDWHDLIILKAQNYFVMSQFDNCLKEITKLNPNFYVDISTNEGLACIASEIERLYNIYN